MNPKELIKKVKHYNNLKINADGLN